MRSRSEGRGRLTQLGKVRRPERLQAQRLHEVRLVGGRVIARCARLSVAAARRGPRTANSFPTARRSRLAPTFLARPLATFRPLKSPFSQLRAHLERVKRYLYRLLY